MESDLALIVESKGGNKRSFNQLVVCHREGVVELVYRMCGDLMFAEEVAQEAFIRAWQNLPSYEPRSPFRNWLYRIVTNVALDMLRRERQTVALHSVSLSTDGEGPEEIAERKERAAVVQRAVLALPPASRAVLVLREYGELSYREIAETLDIPMGTVMSRLNYARSRLREALTPYLEEL